MIILQLVLLSLGFAQYKYMPDVSEDEMKHRLKYVDYTAMHSFERKVVKKKWSFGRRIIRSSGFLSYSEFIHGLQGKLKVDFYFPQGIEDKKLPVIVIFPPIGGVNYVDRSYAKYFAAKGYIAVISQLEESIDGLNTIPETTGVFARSVIRNRILLDYLWSHPNVDKQRIGVFGNSLGGIRAALFYGIDTRVKSAAIVVGSGNMPGTIAYSNQEIVVRLRNRMMASHNIKTPEELEHRLREEYLIDPTNFSRMVNPRDFYMVIGKRDNKVPTFYQKELFKKFGMPYSYSLPLNHIYSIFVAFFGKYRIGHFFDLSFAVENARNPDPFDNSEDIFTVYKEIKEAFN
tara:strand:+ start:30845 stop:31879 length:1035 start_codon:yes stop_codon:yes gene_type:complete